VSLRHRPTYAVLVLITGLMAIAGVITLLLALWQGDHERALREVPFALVGAVPLVLVLRTRVELRPSGARIINFARRVDITTDEVVAVHVGTTGSRTWVVILELADGGHVRLWSLTGLGPRRGEPAGEGPEAFVRHAQRLRLHLGVAAST
jgi:hypothetical protein